MKFFNYMILIVFIIRFPSISIAQEINTQQLFEKCSSAVVTIKAEDKNGAIFWGSAVLISEDGIALTAWHLLASSVSVKAKFSDGEEYEVSGIKDKDVERDICSIKIKCFGKPYLNLSKKTPKIGEKVVIIGAPKGLEFSISDGILGQIQTIGNIKYYQFTCPASQGNSGGPLINNKGEIIGIVSWQVKDGQNLNFAIPSMYALGLDNSLPTNPLSGNSNKKSEPNKFSSDGDKILALLFNYNSEYKILGDYLINEYMRKENGYKEALPYFFFTFIEEMETLIIKAREIKYSEVGKDKIKATIIAEAENSLKTLKMLEESINLARNNNGWRPEISDMVSKATSMAYKQFDLSITDLKTFFMNSTEFTENIYPDLKDFIANADPEYGKYKFGVGWLHLLPTSVLVVNKNSFAENIGLMVGDRIIKINNTQLTSFLELKKEIFNLKGKKATLILSRKGEVEEIEFEVPEDLITKYGAQ